MNPIFTIYEAERKMKTPKNNVPLPFCPGGIETVSVLARAAKISFDSHVAEFSGCHFLSRSLVLLKGCHAATFNSESSHDFNDTDLKNTVTDVIENDNDDRQVQLLKLRLRRINANGKSPAIAGRFTHVCLCSFGKPSMTRVSKTLDYLTRPGYLCIVRPKTTIDFEFTQRSTDAVQGVEQIKREHSLLVTPTKQMIEHLTRNYAHRLSTEGMHKLRLAAETQTLIDVYHIGKTIPA